MKVKLFSLLDNKLSQFNTPMSFQSQGLAQRAFQDEVNRDAADNPMFRYPDDFSLHYVGEFDAMTGNFLATGSGVPELVCRGIDVKL